MNCKAHELDNLYVVDTSFFPSIGAVNPALTAMANALRVGDHLLERLGASSGREAVGSGAGRTTRDAQRIVTPASTADLGHAIGHRPAVIRRGPRAPSGARLNRHQP